MNWPALLESTDLRPIRKLATCWRTCPVGVRHPMWVERRHGAWDVVQGCPPKLIKFGIQFMEAMENDDRDGALRVYQKIADFKVLP